MKKEKNKNIYRKNSFYHIYNRGNHKENIFCKEKDYFVFHRLMYKYLKKYNILLIVYCYMPTHYHFIFKCGKNWERIPRLMSSFMTSYVLYFNRKYQKVGHLFQGPFQVRRIIGKNDLASTISYIRNNPVEASLVDGRESESYRWLYIKKYSQESAKWRKPRK